MSPIAIVSIILLLVFAGFLAASESALTSISRIVIDELEGKRGGALLRKYSAQPARYLNVILLVRKLCEFTATVLLAVYFAMQLSICTGNGINRCDHGGSFIM
jgi:CBS domain containing-hemolysin-like protein